MTRRPLPYPTAKFISAFSHSLSASLSASVQIKVRFPLCGVPAQGSLMELKLLSGCTHCSHYISFWCACSIYFLPVLLKTDQYATKAALNMYTVYSCLYMLNQKQKSYLKDKISVKGVEQYDASPWSRPCLTHSKSEINILFNHGCLHRYFGELPLLLLSEASGDDRRFWRVLRKCETNTCHVECRPFPARGSEPQPSEAFWDWEKRTMTRWDPETCFLIEII